MKQTLKSRARIQAACLYWTKGSCQMPAHPALDSRFTPELRFRVESFLASITQYEPTLVVMKGRRVPYAAERWDYGAYGPENIRSVGAELERIGKTLLHIVDGIVVAIPQFHLLRELTGKTLGLDKNGSIVIGRETDV